MSKDTGNLGKYYLFVRINLWLAVDIVTSMIISPENRRSGNPLKPKPAVGKCSSFQAAGDGAVAQG